MSKLAVTIEGYTFEIELDGLPIAAAVRLPAEEFDVIVDGQTVRAVLPETGIPTGQELAWFILDDYPFEVLIDPELTWMRSRWGIHSLEVQDLELQVARPHTGDGRIKAPIPGQITRLMVAAGDEVEPGQPLLVLEAMKMENEIRAPRSGVIRSLNVIAGQRVSLHELLAEIE